MKRFIPTLIASLIVMLCCCTAVSHNVVYAEGDSLVVVYSDILRGARSNVNRELLSVNIEDDGVVVGGVTEAPAKAVLKAGIKKGTAFGESFSVTSEILSADAGMTMDLGFIYGDIDEVWLDPWDFLGIDMNDPGSLGKFKGIGGFTVRFALTGNSISTLMMKGFGDNLPDAAFAVAGITEQLPFVKDRDVCFEKKAGNWVISSGGRVLPFEANATKLNPGGQESAQAFINKVLDAAVGKTVYPFIAIEGSSSTSSAYVKIKTIGGKTLTARTASDALVGDVTYNPTPEKSIDFSLMENYYLHMPEYEDINFTYLSQAYMNPTFTVTENGLNISGRDMLYGVNGDLTYLNPFEHFDGFTAVMSVGEMPATTSQVNSNISLTLNGQKFASYYAWNSIYVKITFPHADFTKGYNATVYLWGERTTQNVMVAEMPITHIPYVEGGDIVIKIAKTGENYYIYINGVRFGDGYEAQLKSTIEKIEKGYTDASGTSKGFYVSTINTTAYYANGLGVSDIVLKNKTPNHYLKQIGGMAIVNNQAVLKPAERPYLPLDGDVTESSVKFSFSAERPDRTDGNFAVDGYVIERYVDGALDGEFKLVGAENRTFVDEGLEADTHYTYRVYAVQGVETDNPIRLVAYQPIVIKTLRVEVNDGAKAPFIAGLLGIGGIAALVAIAVISAIKLFGKIKNTAKANKERTVPAYVRAHVSLNRNGFKLKPIVMLLVIALTVCTLGGCKEKNPSSTGSDGSSPSESTGGSQSSVQQIVKEKNVDTFENLVGPNWKIGFAYNETVMMLKGKDGVISGKLAFAPTRVISVRNYALNTVYEEGKDYSIDENGVITLTENSACPYLLEENLIFATRPQGVNGLYEFPSSTSLKPNIMYTETDFIVNKQLCVTYEYDTALVKDGIFATANKSKLPALRQKLANKETVRLAVVGDSISQGANSSAMLGVAPYQPTYSVLFRQYLENAYGIDVVFENFSLGGQTSAWGASRAYAAGQFMPDLVILSFGANDGGVGVDNTGSPISVNDYCNNMQAAMDNVRKYNPNCEFIVVSSLVPNPAGAAYGIQGEYATAMDELYSANNSVVTVDMYRVHEYYLTDCGKKYVDITSNNVNHPNDFLIRLYTQNIISSLW